jgi:hypothetical protein
MVTQRQDVSLRPIMVEIIPDPLHSAGARSARFSPHAAPVTFNAESPQAA